MSCNQGGRRGRSRLHSRETKSLLPPTQQIKNNIFIWRNPHLKLTGKWQKKSCVTKAIRKIDKELSRKGRKSTRSAPPGRRIGGKEQLHRDPSWEVSSLNHILATPTLGSNARKTSPLGWLEGWWAAPEGQRKARTLLMRHV